MIDKRQGETKKPIPTAPPIFDKSHKVVLPKNEPKSPKQCYDN